MLQRGFYEDFNLSSDCEKRNFSNFPERNFFPSNCLYWLYKSFLTCVLLDLCGYQLWGEFFYLCAHLTRFLGFAEGDVFFIRVSCKRCCFWSAPRKICNFPANEWALVTRIYKKKILQAFNQLTQKELLYESHRGNRFDGNYFWPFPRKRNHVIAKRKWRVDTPRSLKVRVLLSAAWPKSHPPWIGN